MFKIGPNGPEPAPNAPVAGDPSRSHASQMGSAVHDAKSVYIGNSRYSYDMTNRTLEMHKLKANHIPVYLQSSTTASDLPSGHNATHMTVNKWIDFARSHLSDDTLDVHDVFPYTNADWDAADAPTPTLTAAYNAMSTDVDTLETEMDDVEADIARLTGPSVEVYVDVSQTGSYVEDGSALKPYKTLQAALSAKLVDGVTASYIFKLRTGTYNVGSGISITHTNATMNFTIQGESDGVVIHCTDITTDVLYFRRFKGVIFRRLNIAQGKYGLYLRNCTTAQLDAVQFTALGSTAVAGNHDFTNTQAEQAAVWASATTSDGGACRIRDVTKVDIQNCFVNKCLRGLRLQDINSTIAVSSIVANNMIMDTLESGIYLASGTYGFANNASVGCRHVLVSGNNIVNAYNNGILNIGSQACSFIGNSIYHSANAGIQQHASVDCSYVSNVLFDCNSLSHNGIGNLGDAWANIHLATNTGIDANSGTYLAAVKDNTVLKCGQGRASSVIGIKVLDTGVTYPANYKVVLDSNITHDGTVENPESVTVVGGSDLSAYSTTAQMNTALALKQDVVGAGDLHIAHTSGLQTALDAKQDTQTFTAGRAIVSGSGGGLRNSTVTSAEILHLDGVTSSIQTQLDGKQATIGDGDLTIARTSGLQTALDGKQASLSVAQMSVVNGDVFSSGGLSTMLGTKQNSLGVAQMSVVNGDVFSSGGLTTMLNTKQAALTRTNIGTVTWSAGQQQTTIANVTAKQGYFVIVPTLNQTTITAAQRTVEVTVEIASLAETDMVIVPRYPMSNHTGGAINVTTVRPNSDLGSIRITCRSAANVDYTGNTTDKFFVSYLVL